MYTYFKEGIDTTELLEPLLSTLPVLTLKQTLERLACLDDAIFGFSIDFVDLTQRVESFQKRRNSGLVDGEACESGCETGREWGLGFEKNMRK